MIAAIYAIKSTEQNDVADGPPFGATLTEDLDPFKGARPISKIPKWQA